MSITIDPSDDDRIVISLGIELPINALETILWYRRGLYYYRSKTYAAIDGVINSLGIFQRNHLNRIRSRREGTVLAAQQEFQEIFHKIQCLRDLSKRRPEETSERHDLFSRRLNDLSRAVVTALAELSVRECEHSDEE